MAITRIHTSPTALRRQKQIEDCLYENLLRSSYQSISVADICRQVGISRKAFYNYYNDKDACFCAIIDRLLEEAMLQVSALPDTTTSLENAAALLDYWKGKKEFLDIVVRNNLLYFLIIRNMEHVLREDRTTLDLLNTDEVGSDTDILACYMASQLALMLQWYSRDFRDPTGEMAKKLLRIVHAPMIDPHDSKI